MSVYFRTLATLAISHEYYGGACHDFDFVIPGDSAGTLRAGRMLARSLDGRLHLLFEAHQDGSPVCPLPGEVLRLGLRLGNPYFGNFTVSPAASANRLALYANHAGETALAPPREVQLAAGMFKPQPQLGKRPLIMRLKDAAGHVVATQSLAASEEAAAFDLRPLGLGSYVLEEDYADEVRSSALYLHPELIREGVYALVELTIASSFYSTSAELEIHFQSRKETIKYYVVASKFGASEFGQLLVKDHGFTEDGRAEIQFDKVQPGDFTPGDIQPSTLGDASARIVLFQSRFPVARNNKGLRKIQLTRSSDVLVEHLPQPGASRGQAHHIIHLSKP